MPADRGYYDKLQYLWTYGDQSEVVGMATNLTNVPFDRNSIIANASVKKGIRINGWLGTVLEPRQLKDEHNDNLNKIAVFMRGKLALEDVLDSFGQKEIYADYVIGEIYCDDLDVDEKEDLATSSRQNIKEDDPQFQTLREILLVSFVT